MCKYVRYWGQVQGVGFRYTCRQLAERFKVGGYVRNVPDGSVELLVEGEPAAVQGLLDAVAGQMSGYIEKQEIEDRPPQGLREFTIRH